MNTTIYGNIVDKNLMPYRPSNIWRDTMTTPLSLYHDVLYTCFTPMPERVGGIVAGTIFDRKPIGEIFAEILERPELGTTSLDIFLNRLLHGVDYNPDNGNNGQPGIITPMPGYVCAWGWIANTVADADVTTSSTDVFNSIVDSIAAGNDNVTLVRRVRNTGVVGIFTELSGQFNVAKQEQLHRDYTLENSTGALGLGCLLIPTAFNPPIFKDGLGGLLEILASKVFYIDGIEYRLYTPFPKLDTALEYTMTLY